MVSVMRFVTVQPDGNPGDELGSFELVGDRIEASPGVAEETIAMLRRRSRKDDPALCAWLIDNGWSNGQIMIVR